MLSFAEILGPAGRIAARLNNYEHRREQLEMAEAVTEAMDKYAVGQDEEARRIIERARDETASFNEVAGAAAAPALAADLDAVMVEMEAAEDDSRARGAVVKSKKAESRSSSRGQ